MTGHVTAHVPIEDGIERQVGQIVSKGRPQLVLASFEVRQMGLRVA
jgi:hypothetical protein